MFSSGTPRIEQPPARPGLRIRQAEGPGERLSGSVTGAWFPDGGRYIDVSRYGNSALGKAGNAVFLPKAVGNGHGYQFTTSDSFITGTYTPAFGVFGGYSLVMWVKFANTPTNYGSILGRSAGTGGDWEVDHLGAFRRLTYARNGAELAQSTTGTDTEWHLWALCVDAAGAWTWYTDEVANGSGTGLMLRDANGALHFNNRAATNRANSALGRVYQFGKCLNAAELAWLRRNEWLLLEPARKDSTMFVGSGSAFKAAWVRNRSQVIGAGVR